VDLKPTASITTPASNVTITAGESVNFQGTLSSGNAPFTHLWTFGTNGPASVSVEDPGSVTFPAAGTYTVTYTARDKENDSSSASVTVTVKAPYVNVAPVASISSPAGNVTITEGASVNFQASVTSGNAPFTHLWTFGTGGPSNKTVEDPGNVVFPTAGTYTVTYAVSDNEGDKSTATVTVTVTKPYVDVIPTAFITSPASNVTITEGSSVKFEGSITSGNAPFTYAWNFGNGGPSAQTVANPGNVVFPKAGTYTVTYGITDNDSDKSTASVTVTVLAPVVDLIPVASVASPVSNVTISKGQSVNFKGLVKDGDAPFTYKWDFSDSGVSVMTVQDPGDVTFPNSGTYKVTFTVTDGDKDTSSASVTVTVNADVPVVTPAPAPVLPENLAQVSLTPELTADSSVSTGYTEWQISTDPEFTNIVMDVTRTVNGKSLKVPELVLNGQTTYYWRMKTKSTKGASDWSKPAAFITVPETWNDANGNGIPDSQDVSSDTDLNHDGIIDRLQPDVIKVVKCYNGKGVFGIAKLSNVTDIEILSAMDDTTISDKLNRPSTMPMGLAGFRIVTSNPGDKVMIGIHLSEPAPANAGWYKYDSVKGWQNYSAHANFSQDRKMVTVELTDGGEGDADGCVNGVIVDPAGIGVMTAPAGTIETSDADGGSGKGCFIDASTNGTPGKGFGFILALLLAGVIFIRLSDKKNAR
jgi:major membrane immunogen (membrane-anchored lipoprotein)